MPLAVDAEQVDPADMPRHREIVAGRALVRLAGGLGNLAAGEGIAFAIPQENAVFDAHIEEVHPGPEGARAFSGTLGIEGGVYGFLLTVGRSTTFANISTPQERYELVGNRRYAWLMPRAMMDRDVDYRVPDYHPASLEAPPGFDTR